jgi:hypothetical protein
MGIEGCDCSAFERREKYISCESLMAGEISSLKGKKLPRDLFDMDQREYAVIKAEEIDLEALEERRKRLGSDFFAMTTASFVASLVCVVFRNFVPVFIFTGIGFMSAACFVITSMKRTPAEKNKIRDIDDNRLARLRNKVGILEAKINDVAESKEDLIATRDFFKTKYKIYLGVYSRA